MAIESTIDNPSANDCQHLTTPEIEAQLHRECLKRHVSAYTYRCTSCNELAIYWDKPEQERGCCHPHSHAEEYKALYGVLINLNQYMCPVDACGLIGIYMKELRMLVPVSIAQSALCVLDITKKRN